MTDKLRAPPFGSGSCPLGQAPTGLDASRCDPSRGTWVAVQFGYEKFGIYDERGTDIGFAHRRRDAALFAASPWLYDAAEDAVEALKLVLVGLSDNRAAVDMINLHIDMLQSALTKASAIEAQRATTPQSGVVHEHAVPERQTPNLCSDGSQGGNT